MPKGPMPEPVAELLAQPNPAVMASARPDGQTVSVATWYLVENGRILVNMDSSRKRIAYLKEDPRVSLTALKDGDWGTHVSIQGRIVEWIDDKELTDIDRLANHYGVGDYPIRTNPRVSAWIEIDRWHGWGAVANAS